MHHIVNLALGNHCHVALGNHCHLAHPLLMSRQEQSLIFINIYMSDSVNYDKVMYIYLILIVNLCHFLSMHFLLHFLLITSPCFDIVPLSKPQLDSIYGMKYACTSDINDSIYIYIYIYIICIYTVWN